MAAKWPIIFTNFKICIKFANFNEFQKPKATNSRTVHDSARERHCGASEYQIIIRHLRRKLTDVECILSYAQASKLDIFKSVVVRAHCYSVEGPIVPCHARMYSWLEWLWGRVRRAAKLLIFVHLTGSCNMNCTRAPVTSRFFSGESLVLQKMRSPNNGPDCEICSTVITRDSRTAIARLRHRNSVRLSVRHTGGSGKNGAS